MNGPDGQPPRQVRLLVNMSFLVTDETAVRASPQNFDVIEGPIPHQTSELDELTEKVLRVISNPLWQTFGLGRIDGVFLAGLSFTERRAAEDGSYPAVEVPRVLGPNELPTSGA